MKNEFKITNYQIKSNKIQKRITALLIGDLHCAEYGSMNRELIYECMNLKPDVILSTGDLVTAGTLVRADGVFCTLKALTKIAPVYAVDGNHEAKNVLLFPNVYKRYLRVFGELGIHLLNNRTEEADIGGVTLTISGLSLPLTAYKKLRVPHLEQKEIDSRVTITDRKHYSILLAHNPQFIPGYFRTGADLVLSGHFHGGVMRFGAHGTLVSPYGLPLPKYGYGLYRNGGQSAIVTSGLGEHAIPFRINNPLELVRITLEP